MAEYILYSPLNVGRTELSKTFNDVVSILQARAGVEITQSYPWQEKDGVLVVKCEPTVIAELQPCLTDWIVEQNEPLDIVAGGLDIDVRAIERQLKKPGFK